MAERRESLALEGNERRILRARIGRRPDLGDDESAIGDLDRLPGAHHPQVMAQAVLQLFRPDPHAATVAPVATSCNPVRGGSPAIGRVEQLWDLMDRVGASVELAVRAGALAHAHDLSAYDAVHLAAAEAVATADLVFVAADPALCTAAARLGLAVARLAR